MPLFPDDWTEEQKATWWKFATGMRPPKEENAAMGELAQFVCHKVVRAGKLIGRLANDVLVVEDRDGRPLKLAVPPNFFARGEPDTGDYIVQYEPDNYTSWSPKAAFEDGYTKMTVAHATEYFDGQSDLYRELHWIGLPDRSIEAVIHFVANEKKKLAKAHSNAD